ncbi:MAG: hypothetical protein EA384_09120 [Spirochaetaceae bacterium]|nr:MAG: hypothetical protein EA384_09120 [Spirochaetaceae bacterium]
MAIQTKFVRNALVYYDDRYPARWVDAVGENVVKWELDLGPAQSAANVLSRFATTTAEATIAQAVTAGDRLLITTGVEEYNGTNMQLHGSAFRLTAGMPLYFGARVATEAANKGDYLIGLCGVDTALLNTASSHGLDVDEDGVYFYQLNAGTTWTAVNQAGATINSVATGLVRGANIKRDLEFFFDGATLTFYADGIKVGSLASGLAPKILTPSINVRAGDADAEQLNIEWMRAIQVRG